MHKHDNTIIAHSGALGDFFLAWPALRRLRLSLPDQPVFWHGRRDRLPWLTPMGFQPCPPALATAVDALCAAGSWPEPLARSRVAWFGLGKPPALRDPRCWYIQGLRSTEAGQGAHVRLTYSMELKERGIAAADDWRLGWRECLPSWSGPDGRREVLIFPGAGHRLKQWPLVKFIELAGRLAGMGLAPRFVLGPAEVERGLCPAGWPRVILHEPRDLQDLLLTARLAIGNDSGPMHMAGMLGVPTVAIFGPTSRRQWAPEGVIALAAPREAAPCRPCTLTTHGLACADPVCLKAVDVEEVVRAAREALDQDSWARAAWRLG